jgi:SAM-dependent methyltransferase
VILAPPLAAEARRMHLAGDAEGARRALERLVADVTGLKPLELSVNADEYSLNSLNGTVQLADGNRFFFKFHSEEGEESTIAEYYNAELLRRSGYDVDVPVYACGEPGRQILLYGLRSDARLADVCRSIELGEGRYDPERVIAAQVEHDRSVAERMIESLHAATPAEVAAEPIHQLFWNRLVSPDVAPDEAPDAATNAAPVPGFGGRVDRFYVGKPATLGSPPSQVTLDWNTLRDATWVIDGIEYRDSLGDLFAEAGRVLRPEALGGSGAVVAHGDEHNANVWFEDRPGERPRLVSFDPAFAGPHLPALIADVKATFHNVYAHPFWLYEPALAAERYTVRARVDEQGRVAIDSDFAPSPLRLAFRDSKAENVWRPLIAALRSAGMLPVEWQRIVRLALFCCPTLVLDLRASGSGAHNPVSSALGLSIAIAAGSTPVDPAAEDAFTALFAALGA